MPDSYPGIVFDGEGVCSLCLSFKPKDLLGQEAFLSKLRSRPSGGYVAVLGISGGKDSCYVAYLAKRALGLNVLAVFYDFPFIRDLARENVKNVCDALGLDLVTVRSRNSLEYGLVRNHLISIAATGTTWGQCLFCHYGIDAVLYDAARARGAPFILSGITRHELWDPGSRARVSWGRIRRLPIFELARFAYYQSKACLGLLSQRREFAIPGNNCFNVYARAKIPSADVEVVPVFDYFPWDQAAIERTLTQEVGWIRPQKPLSWRYDCMLEPLLDHTYKKEFGVSTVGLYLSGLVRSGLITREKALSMLDEGEDEALLRRSLEHALDYLRIPRGIQRKFLRN